LRILAPWRVVPIEATGDNMLSRSRALLSLAALLCSSPASAKPATEPQEWYSSQCENADLRTTYPLPEGLTREDVLRDLVVGPLVETPLERESICTVFGKRWKLQKVPTVLAFVETAFDKRRDDKLDGFIDTTQRLRIGMYRQDATGRYRLVAKSSDGSAYDFQSQEAVSSLDFAPYKLTPTEYAFGVRMHRNFTYAGGGGEQETLVLYRVEGDGMRPILTTLMSSRSMIAGDWHEDGTRDHQFNGDGNSADISVSKKRTQGFFDLKKRGNGRSAVFKWNGDSYELRGRDPVEDTNPYG
jgi:hypothetical protein